MKSHTKSLELTGIRHSGSSRQADNRDQADLIRACSSTLWYATLTEAELNVSVTLRL